MDTHQPRSVGLDPLLSVRDLAAYLGVPRQTIYSATMAAWIGRLSRLRQRPSSTVRTLLAITTWVCSCGSPARGS